MYPTRTRIVDSTWTVPLAALLLVGMLFTFYMVVSNATKAGELRRNAMANKAAAVMRCNASPDWNQNKTCKKELDLQQAADASLAVAVR